MKEGNTGFEAEKADMKAWAKVPIEMSEFLDASRTQFANIDLESFKLGLVVDAIFFDTVSTFMSVQMLPIEAIGNDAREALEQRLEWAQGMQELLPENMKKFINEFVEAIREPWETKEGVNNFKELWEARIAEPGNNFKNDEALLKVRQYFTDNRNTVTEAMKAKKGASYEAPFIFKR